MGKSRATRRSHDDSFALAWVKPAKQDRSRDTHARIVEAAERLLAEGRSWSELTVADLVAEAETSIGAFYNRFRDKDALLHVLQIELYEQGEATAAQARALAASAAVPLDVLVRAFVTLAVTSYRAQFGLRRALLEQMSRDERFRARAIELTRTTCDGLVAVLAPRYRHVNAERLRTTVDVAHRIVYGLLDQNLLFADRATGRALDDTTLVDELAVAIRAYLERSLERSEHARR